MKKILHILITLLLTTASFAQTTFTIDNIEYEILDETLRTVSAVGGENVPGNFIIPETVENNDTEIEYTVIEIGIEAFMSKSLISVTLPDSVTLIRTRAFNTNNINTINFGEGVQEIQLSAFGRNDLVSISLPASLQTIGTFAFFNNPTRAVESLAATPPSVQNESFFGRDNISLTVPEGTEAAYEAAGWTGFQTVNDAPFIGLTFTIDGLQYTVDQLDPNTVNLSNGVNANGNVQIPTSVTFNEVTYSVTSISNSAFLNGSLTSITIPNSITTIQNDAFRNNQLTTVEIPESVINIGNSAFRDNRIDNLNLNEGLQTIRTSAFEGNNLNSITIPNGVITIDEDAFDDNPLITVISESLVVPTLGSDAFGSVANINLTVPTDLETTYEEGGWTGFFSVNGNPVIGRQFSVDGFSYEVTSANPNTVELNGGIGDVTGDLVIPTLVSKNNISFTVTSLGFQAFDGEDLTSVIIPATIERLSNAIFRDNRNLVSIVSLNTTPPTLGGNIFNNTQSLAQITVPVGAVDAYAEAGWPASLLTEATKIELKLKAFLQGAYINTNTTEEDLRNDLQEAALIPLTSTYADERSAARTSDTNQFFSPFELKVADWIFVEIRDANEPSSVLDSRSLLLKTNGDIVDFTLDSEFTNPTFDQPLVDEYLVVIKHRNHISIRTANAILSDQSFVNLDFTNDPTLVEGGENALSEVSDGIFAMIAGDVDENGQIQPSDVNDTTAAIGTSTYSNADMDMNGQIQPADVNNLVNPNVGRGVQF